MGPNLLTLAVRLWDKGVSIDNIRDLLAVFGARFNKAAVQHAVTAGSKRLEPEAGAMEATLAESKHLKLDESPVTIVCKQGYIWVCIGDDAVVFKVAGTRGRTVIYEFFPYTDKPATVDGYMTYLAFGIIQRCWARILREAEDPVRIGNPQMAALHGMLQYLFHEAKLVGENPPGAPLQYGPMTARHAHSRQVPRPWVPVWHNTCQRSAQPVHFPSAPGHGADQQRLREKDPQGGNPQEDPHEAGHPGRNEDVRHGFHLYGHVAQAGSDGAAAKGVQRVDLTSYALNRQ